MTGAEMRDKLLFLSANQRQAIDIICLLLDGLELEGKEANQGTAQAGIFVKRLLIYVSGHVSLYRGRLRSRGQGS